MAYVKAQRAQIAGGSETATVKAFSALTKSLSDIAETHGGEAASTVDQAVSAANSNRRTLLS